MTGRGKARQGEEGAYFVEGAQVAGDEVALLRVDEDAVVVVIADVADEHRLLADGQKSALDGRYLFKGARAGAMNKRAIGGERGEHLRRRRPGDGRGSRTWRRAGPRGWPSAARSRRC